MPSLHHARALVASHPCPRCVTPVPSLHHTHALVASHLCPCCITPMPSLHHAMVPPAPCLVLALVHASSHFIVLDVDVDVEAWLSVVRLLWGIEKGGESTSGRWDGNWVQDGLRVGSRIEQERCVPILSYSNPPIQSIQPPSPQGAGTFISCIIQRGDTFGHQASTRMVRATLVLLYFFGQSREDHARDDEANQAVLIRQTELQPRLVISHSGNELWPSHLTTSPTCCIPGPQPTHKLRQE